MRIGVVGSGNMGRSLGVLLAELGHEVLFGARCEEQARAAAMLAGELASHGTNSEAARFGEIIVWTVRDVSAREVVPDLSLLENKPVIDMSNLPSSLEARSMVRGSMAEQLQSEMAQAHVVKAFNNFSIEMFELAPTPLDQYNVSVFLASDHERAKSVVAGLARSMGCVPVDCGGLANARILENLGDLVRILIRQGHPLTVALSVKDLDSAAKPRLGRREPSRLS